MKRKLKKWVLPTLYVMVFAVLIGGAVFLNRDLMVSEEDEKEHVVNIVSSEVIPVNEEVEKKVGMPYNSETVTVSKTFYNKDDEASKQEGSLILYEKTYLPNTGVLYQSDNQFDILSIFDGTVSDVKKDDILGNVVSIDFNNSYHVVYHSLDTVNVTKDARVLGGDVIGTSGDNNLEGEKENCLLIEVYKDGNLINPLDFYGATYTSLNE